MPDDYNNNQNGDGEYQQSPEDQFAREQAPAVSAPPAKNMIFFGTIAIVLFGLVYLVFMGGGNEGKTKKIQPPTPPKIAEIQPPVPYVPNLPKPPEVPPVLPPEPPAIDAGEAQTSAEETDLNNPETKKRLQSNLLISGGGILSGTDLGGANSGPRKEGINDVYAAANDNDPNIGFADSFFNQKNVPNAFARKLGDTNRLITQGKIIEAVLETPINTDVPGMIRGVVSRDIYAESGRAILIPKGSRLVGTYNNFIVRGNKRVNVIWSRVIRPDGIDIMIRSPGADQLGRAGVAGDVDNKYLEIFSGAFLVSAINIAVGFGVDSLQNDKVTQTTNTDGSTTKQSSAAQEATLKAVDLFGNAGTNLIQGFLNTKPTITIDQGTRISVFVNRDLVFPSSLTGQVRFIQ